MLEDGEYRCVCGEGWAGRDCGIRLETECNDKKDNDNGEWAGRSWCALVSRASFLLSCAESPQTTWAA